MQARPSPSILVPLLRDVPDLSALHDPVSWRAVREAAAWHKMSAVVAFAVRAHGSAEQRRWCDEILTQCWRRHDRNIGNLDRILRIMAGPGVEVLALKGPILGLRHFRPPFLRRISVDIDLAVRDTDLKRAVNELASHGYVPTLEISETGRTSHHLGMVCPGAPTVELHTRLSKMSLGMPVEPLFDSAVECLLPTGTVAKTPCPKDELLGLFVHLAGDRFASFSHLFELRQIWRAAPPSLRADVLEEAVKQKVSATIWLAHVALLHYWGEGLLEDETRIPTPWLRRHLNENFLRQLEENVTVGGARGLGERLRGRWLDLHMTESSGEMVRMLLFILKVAVREAVARRWGPVARPVAARSDSTEG